MSKSPWVKSKVWINGHSPEAIPICPHASHTAGAATPELFQLESAGGLSITPELSAVVPSS